MQQASDYELELMRVIWENGGSALYAEITAALEKKRNYLDQKYGYHAVIPING